MATAATVMLGFAGLLGGQSLCITRQCPIVVAAEHEHANITAGARGQLAKSDDLAQLTKAVSEKVDGASGFPSLCRCHLNPLRCGVSEDRRHAFDGRLRFNTPNARARTIPSH